MEVPEGVSEHFVGFLPPSLPGKIIFVITTTKATQLGSTGVVPHLSLTIPPLTQYECEMLVENLQPELELHRKLECIEGADGHPLLLTFLLREAACIVEGEAIAAPPGLDSLEKYYEKLYSRLSKRGHSVWILATIANLRYSMDEAELIKTLLPDEQPGYFEAMAEIRHLLNPDLREVRLYHQSLVDFVRSKTQAIHDAIHERLTTHCRHQATDYARANLIHHCLRSRQSREAMACATQDYFDEAALVFAPPELLLADLTELIVTRLEAGSYAQIWCMAGIKR